MGNTTNTETIAQAGIVQPAIFENETKANNLILLEVSAGYDFPLYAN